MAEDSRAPAPPWMRRLFEPVDIASLVVFRIAFGAILLREVWRFFAYDWIRSSYLEPDFLFKYLGFGWVQPWPGDGLYYHFAALGVLAIFVAVGFLYRLSAFLLFLTFTYVFLLDQGQYLNHFYFVSLVSFLMIFVPANRAFSVDAWLRGAKWSSPWAPTWALWALRAEMGFVYFFAGVAKLDADWLQGYPLRTWLARDAADVPVLGQFVGEAWLAVGMSWCGMLLDLFIVPALLWRRTRLLAFAAALAFHGLNAAIFNIGIFPWFSIAATSLFFDPDWPRRLLRRPPARAVPGPPARLGRAERATAVALVVFMTPQVLIPLRPHFYSGNPSWTEEGHRFSWRQKLRMKDGYIRFRLTDPESGDTWTVDPTKMLTKRQYSQMAARPHMILQFAHHLADLASEEGKPRVEVRALSLATLNGREMQPLVDRTVDLAAEEPTFFRPYPWILPLSVPLEAQWDGRSPPKHPATLAVIEADRARVRAFEARRRAEAAQDR